MTWLDSPLAALDTETTGTDPETARVVTACVGMSMAPGQWSPMEWRLNPGVPIPATAAAVHGITDADVTDWSAPADALAEIRGRLVNAATYEVPIVGHNLAYDLTLLDREFRRHLGAELPVGLLVLDTLVLFRRFDLTTGGRRLETLATRYGITLDAHDATADALASLRILHILAGENDLLPLVSVAGLQPLQAKWHAAHIEAQRQKRISKGQTAPPESTDWPIRPMLEGSAA